MRYGANYKTGVAMASNPLHPSRAKYLALLKQTTSIELDIVPSDRLTEDDKSIRKVASGDHITLKSHNNTYQRAQRRLQLEQSRQQNNLEQIFSLAIEYIGQDIHFDRIDLDWMMKFTDLAKRSYSATMQDLWAKILAVELGQQGAFSYRSLKTLSELSTKEAMLFYKAVNIATKVGEDRSQRIVTGAYKKPNLLSIFTANSRLSINLSKHGLSYTQLITLAELGLVYEQEIESAPYNSDDLVTINYQGKSYKLKAKHNDITITYYKFTPTGNELAKLVNQEANSSYLTSLLNDFSSLLESQSKIRESI